MKKAYNISLIISIVAFCMPLVGIYITHIFEEELAEAVIGGVMAGSIPGCILGIIAMIADRKRQQTSVIVLSLVPIFLAVLSFFVFVMSFGGGF